MYNIVSKPYRYARKFFILCLLFAAFYVSKPYRYARKAYATNAYTTMIYKFQNLIGMLGRSFVVSFSRNIILFQNLIGMLGRQMVKTEEGGEAGFKTL